jgi:membrane protease subunit HflK
MGLGAVILLLLLSKSWYTVEANEQAVVLRFGRYQSTADPGLHFCIPFVDSVLTADIRERMIRMPFGLADDRPTPRASEADVLMLTGDLNAAAVEWTVQWQVADTRQYLFTFHTEMAEQEEFLQYIITVVGRTVMNRLIGDYSIDEVLTGKRTEIREEAREATQAMLDKYECGIRITDLQLQRVTPPENEAVQTRDKLENEANKTRNTMLPKANAERDRSIREAEGYAARRRSEVNGEIDALMVRYEQYAKAPEETRQRLYLESMQNVLSNVKHKTIIDADLQQLLPLLNLSEGSR